MEYYSPNRKKADCFKKNKVKKNEDDGILVNRLEKNEIIFEIKKNLKKNPTINRKPFFKNFSDQMKDLFYRRIKTFFEYEDSEFSKSTDRRNI